MENTETSLGTIVGLVLSCLACPNWHKSGQIRVFKTTISSQFSKQLFNRKSSHRCILLRIDLNLSGPPKMGSLLIIVVKLYSYKDSDVENIQKINLFSVILDLRVMREIQYN